MTKERLHEIRHLEKEIEAYTQIVTEKDLTIRMQQEPCKQVIAVPELNHKFHSIE